MLKLNKIIRSAVLALALIGFAGGAIAIATNPTFTVADSGGGHIDAG